LRKTVSTERAWIDPATAWVAIHLSRRDLRLPSRAEPDSIVDRRAASKPAFFEGGPVTVEHPVDDIAGCVGGDLNVGLAVEAFRLGLGALDAARSNTVGVDAFEVRKQNLLCVEFIGIRHFINVVLLGR
jgi:hypothetical protein